MITLKIATEDDVPSILVMMEKFYKASPYSDVKYEEQGVLSTIFSIMSDIVNSVIILALDDGVPVGVIAGTSCKSLFSFEKIAAELVWWVEDSHRNTRAGYKLLEAFEYWAFNVIKATGLSMVYLENSNLDRLYSKRGYSKMESSYMKFKEN